MSNDAFSEFPPELILALTPSLSTASLNTLTQTCHRFYAILQPELDSRITPELGVKLLPWASASHPHIVTKLLSPPHSINPNVQPHYATKAPLHVAAETGHVGIATLLLDAGANIHVGLDQDEYQPFHLAVLKGHYPMMELLLSRGALLDSTFGCDGITMAPLHVAASAGDLKLLQWLLDHGANTECRGHHGTALGFALHSRRIEIIKLLLKHGANPEVVVPLNGGWLDGGPPAPYSATLLYRAMGLKHPVSKYNRPPPPVEGRAELMAMLMLHGATKQGAMDTISKHLGKLAEAAEMKEDDFLASVEVMFKEAQSAMPDATKEFDRIVPLNT
ncbi:ankyrin repeat-containing domain protein [Roridomyces roridus]|uniref:Ankyrin repeat-containing domain protein n=1 Tax=Roridomyces roridus TaxID=1738132 RepID=A0AAD7FHT1_9AGAR|nr:ankyrin repeat-containing domain protein [Roridomyces roridus]